MQLRQGNRPFPASGDIQTLVLRSDRHIVWILQGRRKTSDKPRLLGGLDFTEPAYSHSSTAEGRS